VVDAWTAEGTTDEITEISTCSVCQCLALVGRGAAEHVLVAQRVVLLCGPASNGGEGSAPFG